MTWIFSVDSRMAPAFLEHAGIRPWSDPYSASARLKSTTTSGRAVHADLFELAVPVVSAPSRTCLVALTEPRRQCVQALLTAPPIFVFGIRAAQRGLTKPCWRS